MLHQAVREGLSALLEETEPLGGLPDFLKREVHRYLLCGLLEHGFVRVRCAACGDEALVAFSCKGRGLCPSCAARRAHETAAHLVGEVLPRCGYRQWTVSFPYTLRWRLVKEKGLLEEVLRHAVGLVFAGTAWRSCAGTERGARWRCHG